MNGVRTALRGVGQTLITFGIVILLFCAYELWFTNIYTSRQQSELRHANPDILSSAPPPPGLPEFADVSPGQGIAVLRIPRLGRGYLKVIVEGAAAPTRRKAPALTPKPRRPARSGNSSAPGNRRRIGRRSNRSTRAGPGTRASSS